MANTNFEAEKLALERERLAIEKINAEVERKFFRKNLGVLLTATISLAAVLVSASQIVVAYIQRAKEIEITNIIKGKEIEISDKDQELKWKVALLNYVTTNKDSIFTSDKKREQYLSIMLAAFQSKYTDATVQNITELARAETPTPASTPAPKTDNSKIEELVKNFSGADRLIASNQLVQLYPNNSEAVINALIGNILEADDDSSYRVNLYIAFTLSRLRPNWIGTEAQRDKLIRLKSSKNYQDDTFKRRVDEAINNWQRA